MGVKSSVVDFKRSCLTRTKSGQNQAQMVGIEKLCHSQGLLFKFKGTPSREEHKNVLSVFTTICISLVWMSWHNLTNCLTVGRIQDILDIPFSYCMIWPYTVQWHDGADVAQEIQICYCSPRDGSDTASLPRRWKMCRKKK